MVASFSLAFGLSEKSYILSVSDRAEESAEKNAAESNTSSPTGGKKKKKKTAPLRTQDNNRRKRKGASDDNEDDTCGDLKEARNEVKKARRAEAAAKAKLEAAQKENTKKELKLQEKTDQVSSLRRANTNLEKKINVQQAKIIDAATKNGTIVAEKSGTDLELRALQTRYQQLVHQSKDLQKKVDAAEKRNDELKADMAQKVVENNRLKMEDNAKKYEHEVRMKQLEIQAKHVDKSRAVKVAEKTSNARMYERMSKDDRNKVNNEMKEKLINDKANREKERRETYNARVMQATSSMTGATVLSDVSSLFAVDAIYSYCMCDIVIYMYCNICHLRLASSHSHHPSVFVHTFRSTGGCESCMVATVAITSTITVLGVDTVIITTIMAATIMMTTAATATTATVITATVTTAITAITIMTAMIVTITRPIRCPGIGMD